MTVSSIKASSARSRSKTAAKTLGPAPVPPESTQAPKLLNKTPSAGPTAAGKAIKKTTTTAARSSNSSSSHSRTEPAGRAAKLTSIPPKRAANKSMEPVDKVTHEAAAAAEAVLTKTALTVHSAKAPSPRSGAETVAEVVELGSIPPKIAASEAIKLVAQASTDVAAASEAVKKEAVYAIDTYKDAATETLDSTEEMVKAASEVIAGIAEIHQTMWNCMQRVIYAGVEMPAQFATCTSFAELAEKQRNMMRRGFDEWLNVSQEVLMTNRRITDRAIHALESR